MEIVSLGYSCAIATILQRWNVMSSSNVFDDMLSKKLDGVVDLIENNGEGLFQEENVQWQILKGYPGWWAYDKKYNLLSAHDVMLTVPKEDRLIHLHANKSQHVKDVLRLLKSPELLVLRNNHRKEKLEGTVRLYDAISDLRDGRPFELCVFQNAPLADKDWKIPGLEFYRTTNAHYDDGRGEWEADGSWDIALQSVLRKIKINNTIQVVEPPKFKGWNRQMVEAYDRFQDDKLTLKEIFISYL